MDAEYSDSLLKIFNSYRNKTKIFGFLKPKLCKIDMRLGSFSGMKVLNHWDSMSTESYGPSTTFL